uniref:Uncharacterized protein n=1 Tax=Anguilla anguilla TaxID=7936 RepID=A0A0E9TF36_ANGAN
MSVTAANTSHSHLAAPPSFPFEVKSRPPRFGSSLFLLIPGSKLALRNVEIPSTAPL